MRPSPGRRPSAAAACAPRDGQTGCSTARGRRGERRVRACQQKGDRRVCSGACGVGERTITPSMSKKMARMAAAVPPVASQTLTTHEMKHRSLPGEASGPEMGMRRRRVRGVAEEVQGGAWCRSGRSERRRSVRARASPSRRNEPGEATGLTTRSAPLLVRPEFLVRAHASAARGWPRAETRRFVRKGSPTMQISPMEPKGHDEKELAFFVFHEMLRGRCPRARCVNA